MRYEQAAFEMAFGTKKQLPPSDLPEIAFSGRSNVGKSSLLNKLLNRKALARVSATPGKTQTINFFRVGDVRLCDLSGVIEDNMTRCPAGRSLMLEYISVLRVICPPLSSAWHFVQSMEVSMKRSPFSSSLTGAVTVLVEVSR